MKLLIAIAIAAVSFAAHAQGPGPGAGPGPKGPRFDASSTPGWSLMTADERKAHREKMLSFKDYEACAAYMTDHHKQMEARAKEKGKTLPAGPGPGCNHLKK